MRFQIEFTQAFEKSLKKLTIKEQKLVGAKLKIFCDNPFYPSLRTKKVHGFENLFEFSVNMDIRILWRYKDDKIIITLEIGHHDLLDKL